MADAKPFRPMLAADASEDDFARLFKERGMLMASYKMDGIRAVIIHGRLYSRSMKLIPNNYVQGLFSHNKALEGLDGELICGEPCGEGVFARCSSAFMSHDGKPDVKFHVFDVHNINAPFRTRQQYVKIRAENVEGAVYYVKQFYVRSMLELLELEAQALSLGYEGLIVRSLDAPYKQGRSTLKQGWMLKLKRFKDSEAQIVGYEELMSNQNEVKLDERGFTKRSTEKAGKVPAGTLGALIVQDVHNHSWTFNIGTGFDLALRQHIWNNRDRFLGSLVKYKYLAIGTVDKPRHPVFLGFRSDLDM